MEADNRVDLNAVRVFAAVADVGSFHGASARLGLPRSTVSARVAELERRLGVRLLARTTRRVALTDAGRVYLDRIRPALAGIDEADRELRGLAETPRGLVRVSTTHGVAAMWLGDIASRLLQRYPEVSLAVDLSDRYVDLVGEGFDAAIRGGDLTDSTLASRLLATARMACFASPDYLARLGWVPEHPSDLARLDVVVFAADTRATWTFEGPERVTVAVRGRFGLNDPALMADAAVRGLGVARLVPRIVQPHVDAGRLVPLLPGWTSPTMRLQVVTPGTSHRTAAVRAFLDVVQEVAGGVALS